MSVEAVNVAWVRIEKWLGVNAPEALQALAPGATHEAITEAEKILGIELPEEVRASFLRHNGQRIDSGWYGVLYGWEEFPSLTRVCEEWKVWTDLLEQGSFAGADWTAEPQAGIRSDWWNKGWIPLTYDGAGNHACLDLAPAESGKPSQIITMWHDDPTRSLLALSFTRWLEQFADELDAGEYVTHPDYDGLVPREDAADDSDTGKE